MPEDIDRDGEGEVKEYEENKRAVHGVHENGEKLVFATILKSRCVRKVLVLHKAGTFHVKSAAMVIDAWRVFRTNSPILKIH